MKKLFALLLACIMLFLTACNQNPPSETTADNLPNETTSSQNQEKPNESELKDTIIRGTYDDFIETPSRIVFVNPISPNYTFYYSKADGKAYVYCFDPLCDHGGEKCLANPNANQEHIFSFDLANTFFINNRFYTATSYGQIYSFAFDGSDLKIEYSAEEEYIFGEINYYLWSINFRAYDKYIYIRMEKDENGNPHTLRFNTETKEMEDLTAKTGNYIAPVFFYNEEIYGRDSRNLWIKTDLNLKEIETIEAQPTTDQFYGSVFFNNAYDDLQNYNNRKVIGIQAHDMKTGETTRFSNEMLGLEADTYNVVAVDENYVYFYQSKKILLGTYIDHKGKEREQYKYNDGKLYRVKHDGTECACIYDNPEFEFDSKEAVIFGDRIIIKGVYMGVRDGVVTSWDSGMKVGTIGEDGKIEKFENIELVY